MFFCLYNKEDITWRLEGMNFIFEWQNNILRTSASVKGPKRADRRIFVAVRETRKLPGLVSIRLPVSGVRVRIGQC